MRKTQWKQRQQQRKARRALALLLALLLTAIFASVAIKAIRGEDIAAWVIFFSTIGVGAVTLFSMCFIMWLGGDCP